MEILKLFEYSLFIMSPVDLRRVEEKYARGLALIMIISTRPPADLSPARVAEAVILFPRVKKKTGAVALTIKTRSQAIE